MYRRHPVDGSGAIAAIALCIVGPLWAANSLGVESQPATVQIVRKAFRGGAATCFGLWVTNPHTYRRSETPTVEVCVSPELYESVSPKDTLSVRYTVGRLTGFVSAIPVGQVEQ